MLKILQKDIIYVNKKERCKMKSVLVKWFKEQGVRTINGKKLENLGFYALCGYKKMFLEGKTLDVNK